MRCRFVPAPPLVLALPRGRPPGGGWACACHCACCCTPSKSCALPIGGGGPASPGRWPSSRHLIAWSSLFSIACSCPFSVPEPVPARAKSAMSSARLRAHAATHGCWHGLLARTTGVHAPPFAFLSDALNASRSASFSLSSRSRYSSRRAASLSTAAASATDPAAG